MELGVLAGLTVLQDQLHFPASLAEIINSLVNISGADRDLGEDKKVNVMK